MRKIILILISIIILKNISYASFPLSKKEQIKVIELPSFGDDSRDILLLSLAPIPLAAIATIAFSGGSIGFIIGSILGITAILSSIYSIYLNLRTNITFWDWRNYFSMLSAVVLGALALFWTAIVMSFGGIG